MPLSPEEEQEYQALQSALGKDNNPQVDPRSMSPDKLKEYLNHGMKQRAEDATQAASAMYGGEAVGKGVSTIANSLGLTKLPGLIMEKALGIRNAAPGVGQELIDQGLVGTKGMMKNQIQKGYKTVGPQIGAAVDSIPGTLSHAPVSESVGSMQSKFTTPSGATSEAVQPSLSRVQSRAADIASRPDGSAKELFGYKKMAQGEGYNQAGDPLAKLQSQLARKEASGYGKVLEDAYSKANPDAPSKLSDLNKTYSAFSAGEKGLNRKNSGITLMDLIRKTAPTELTGSATAQALDKAGSAAPVAARATTQAVMAPQASSQWSDQDEQEYQQLKSQLNSIQTQK